MRVLARALVVVFLFLPLCIRSQEESAQAPEGYADLICDTPHLLTGSTPVFSSSAANASSIVWDGSAYGVAGVMSGSVYFRRVAADGTLLASSWVSTLTGTASGPSIVWTGTEYGIAWSSTSTTAGDIYFARVSLAGVKQGSDVQITSDPGTSDSPSLAWNSTSTEYGVIWVDSRTTGNDLYFAHISAAGVKQGSEVQVTTDPGSCSHPSMVWNAAYGNFGVVWGDTRTTAGDLYFALLYWNGTKGLGDIQLTSDAAESSWPSLAWTGTQYGVAWRDTRTTTSDVYFCRVSYMGVKQGGDVQVTNVAGDVGKPTLVWTGSEFGVAYEDTRDAVDQEIYFSRVSSIGAKAGTDLRLTTDGNTSAYPALAFGTLGYGMVYTSPSLGSFFVGLGCHADTTGPSCPAGLAISSDMPGGVVLGWSKNGVDRETEVAYSRVYRDGTLAGITTAKSYTDRPRPAGSPVYSVATVNANGWEADGCATVTAVPPVTTGCGTPWSAPRLVGQGYGKPSIVWDGSAYAVAFTGSSGYVSFARMAADGTVLIPPVTVSSWNTTANPSLVWTGSEYAIVWEQYSGNYAIYFARVSAAGMKQGSDVAVSAGPANSFAPSMGWTGSEYGVAWYDTRDGNYEIYFARLSAAGVKQGTDVRVTNDANWSINPSLITVGTNYYIAWSDFRTTVSDIYFTYLNAAGTKMMTDTQITNAPGSSVGPSLVYNGREFAVAWDESSSTGSIYLSRFLGNGVRQGTDTLVSDDSLPGQKNGASLVWMGSGYLVAWQRYLSPQSTLHVASVDPTGTLTHIGPLTSDVRYWSSPALALGGLGQGAVFSGNGVNFVALGCGSVDATAPSCPASPAETARTSTSVTLGWGPSQEPDSDLAHYDITKDGVWAARTLSTTWTDSAFNPVAGPVYIVSATNAAGLTSPACSSVDTSDLVPPTCPENLLASGVTQASATLDWLPSQDVKSGLKQYRIYRNDVQLNTVAAGTTTYTDSTLSANTPYNFAVRSEDWAGNFSATCATASVYISTAPIILMMAKDADRANADLNWNNVNLDQYVVYRSQSPQSASELKRVPVTSTTDPVLNDGVELWFYYIQQRE